MGESTPQGARRGLVGDGASGEWRRRHAAARVQIRVHKGGVAPQSAAATRHVSAAARARHPRRTVSVSSLALQALVPLAAERRTPRVVQSTVTELSPGVHQTTQTTPFCAERCAETTNVCTAGTNRRRVEPPRRAVRAPCPPVVPHRRPPWEATQSWTSRWRRSTSARGSARTS